MPASSTQKHCLQCRRLINGERDAVYRQTHPEKGRARSAKYTIVHPDRVRINSTKYSRAHPEMAKEWAATHPDLVQAKWARHTARRRILDFIPLNKPFDGAEGHHLDKERVVYIPKVVHRSIPHNVFTGYNMAEINALALTYIPKETP
jgi:hypothetical protein